MISWRLFGVFVLRYSRRLPQRLDATGFEQKLDGIAINCRTIGGHQTLIWNVKTNRIVGRLQYVAQWLLWEWYDPVSSSAVARKAASFQVSVDLAAEIYPTALDTLSGNHFN